ncbi:50S ribosomal protein L1 [Wolbachia endosymbiont of Howardula sp.]|uniref:50S ribosomal protein L1 n=1 Tax=Wolbachia endosymbiont of Howardula sp. TaxID=2916816 RepID=UPI00217D81A2|nr:50S ribosomal protein L1 [Wolbachia endosymbiont of Howardula sp.]UWI82985.1 50S ribosomal protein L1 [Wolbachia endosymbiont of Howardula sp.]
MNKHGNLIKDLEQILESSSAKFIESIDVAVNLRVDTRKTEEQIRGTVILPKGIGTAIKIAVFIDKEHIIEAQTSGADIVGSEDLVEEIKRGKKLDVDWCVTTPDFIRHITPIAKILGAKGIMPNPQFNTVTSDVISTINTIKSGQIKFRTDKNGIIHGKIGNASFDTKDLLENLLALIKAIKEKKPNTIKGIFFRSIFLNTTMGKSLKLSKIEDLI